MTEIQCPACSALLNLDISPVIDRAQSAIAPSEPAPVAPKTGAAKEKERLAQFNAEVTAALREFLAVQPWTGGRLPLWIHRDFMRWCSQAPDDSSLRLWAAHKMVTKNRLSKLLVSEIGATWYKGPQGREYRLPEALQPAGGDRPPAHDNEPGPAAGVDLAGAGSLEAAGVASLPLADHVAAVRAQAAVEDAMPVPDTDAAVRNLVMGLGATHVASEPAPREPVDFIYVMKDGVRHKVPIKSPNKEAAVPDTPDYELPEGTVLDGPSVIPVAEPEGGWTAPVTRKWGLLISDEEAGLEPADLEVLFMQRLPEGLLLQGAVDLEYRVDGTPALLGMVASLDGSDPGECWLPAPVADGPVEVAEAAAAPLPSPEQLAAAAGHDALERARARSSAPAAPVFLATEDYEGADPGDWG